MASEIETYIAQNCVWEKLPLSVKQVRHHQLAWSGEQWFGDTYMYLYSYSYFSTHYHGVVVFLRELQVLDSFMSTVEYNNNNKR